MVRWDFGLLAVVSLRAASESLQLNKRMPISNALADFYRKWYATADCAHQNPVESFFDFDEPTSKHFSNPAQRPYFSFDRYPNSRTLSITSAALPSFLRSRRTCVSTVGPLRRIALECELIAE
jgi:hypothetical protein